MLLINKTFYQYFVIPLILENIKIFINQFSKFFPKNTQFLDKNFDFIKNNK